MAKPRHMSARMVEFDGKASILSLLKFERHLRVGCYPDYYVGTAYCQIEKMKELRAYLAGPRPEERGCSISVITARRPAFSATLIPVFEVVLPDGHGRAVLMDDARGETLMSFELVRSLPRTAFGEIGFFNPQHRILHPDNTLPLHLEGFPRSRAHGSFAENQKNFTLRVGNLESGRPTDLICQVKGVAEYNLKHKMKYASRQRTGRQKPSDC